MFIIEVSKCEPTLTGTSIKIVPYDGKSSWQVYNTQHSMVSEATSSRCDAADMLVTLSEYQRCDFEALTLDFCVGGKCVKEISWPQLKKRVKRFKNSPQISCDSLTWLILTIQLKHVNVSLCSISSFEIQRSKKHSDWSRTLNLRWCML